MSNPYISIIMPVYKSEDYLKTSVESILQQTFTDFELLLVDDCSPDNSGAICDEYVKKDDRIKVLHLAQNGGAGNARNEAMKVVAGKYLCFIDADDYIDDNMLYKLAEAVTEFPAKVVVFGLIEEYLTKDGNPLSAQAICYHESKVLKTQQEVRDEILPLEKIDLYGYPCNKMYEVEYLRSTGAKFPKMRFNEDIIFNIDFFMDVDSCIILPIAPYHYLKRSGSTTGSFIPTYFDDIMVKIDRLYDQFKYWDMLTDENLHIIALRYVRYMFSALERNFDNRSGMTAKQRKEFLKKEFHSERYKKFEPYLYGDRFIGIMAKVYKTKSCFLCLTLAKVISIVKKLLPSVFKKIS